MLEFLASLAFKPDSLRVNQLVMFRLEVLGLEALLEVSLLFEVLVLLGPVAVFLGLFFLLLDSVFVRIGFVLARLIGLTLTVLIFVLFLLDFFRFIAYGIRFLALGPSSLLLLGFLLRVFGLIALFCRVFCVNRGFCLLFAFT